MAFDYIKVSKLEHYGRPIYLGVIDQIMDILAVVFISFLLNFFIVISIYLSESAKQSYQPIQQDDASADDVIPPRTRSSSTIFYRSGGLSIVGKGCTALLRAIVHDGTLENHILFCVTEIFIVSPLPLLFRRAYTKRGALLI